MFSWPLVTYVLMAALRDRLIVSLIVLVAVGTSLSVFIGSSAILEKDQFALVFAAAGLRFAGVAGLVLFTVFYVRRAFDTKDIEFLLARPVSRFSFLFSHAVAFSVGFQPVGRVYYHGECSTFFCDGIEQCGWRCYGGFGVIYSGPVDGRAAGRDVCGIVAAIFE